MSTWSTNETINTLPNGYPASLNADQMVGKLLLRDLQLNYPLDSKDYLLLYDGSGIIDLGFDATIIDYAPGRIHFNVTPSTVLDNGIYVTILIVNSSNPITNIRVI
jgi:hypothetical protein